MRLLKESNRSLKMVEILLIFIVPVLLFYYNLIPRSYSVIVLAFYTILILALIFKRHWKLRTLDIRTDNLKKDFVPYAVFSGVGVLALILVAYFLGQEHSNVNLYVLFLGWSIPIAIIQEFLYRGFLMHELRRMYTSFTVLIIVNSLIYTFLHILYNPSFIVLPITFIGGIGFVWMYMKYPNLLLISLSHGILNFVAIWYGFF